MAETQVAFEQTGVFIHSAAEGKDETLCGGKLSIIEKSVDSAVIEWMPLEEPEYLHDHDVLAVPNDADWAVVSTSVGYRVGRYNSTDEVVELRPSRRHAGPLSLELSELKSFKSSSPEQGWAHVTFVRRDNTFCPTLHFHKGGVEDFLEALTKYIRIKRSRREADTFILVDHKVAALEKSFNELQLFGDQAGDLVTKFFNDPYTVTMGGFSKVTNILTNYLVHNTSPSDHEEMAEMLHNSLSSIEMNSQEEIGFEVIQCNDLGPRPETKRGQQMTVIDWTTHVHPDGHVINTDGLREKIFRGGLDPSLRQTAWKYLLGYFSYDMTTKELQEFRRKRVDDYFRMKLQWKSITEEQERRFSGLRDRRSLIEKDVNRTDRLHPFYAGEGNKNIQLLHDILMTYCMYNFDLGYVQGMSDLLAPVLVVMENEVDSFWCFVGFMERVYRNFEMDQQGMKSQLQQLHLLVNFLDPELASYLESHDSGNLYFCFRWLLILFKREFSFDDVMRLWEVLWTDLPCNNFHLLICLAILDTEKANLTRNNFGFTEILKHINELSLRIRLDECLSKAEGMYLQLSMCNSAPQTLRDVIGLAPDPQVRADLIEASQSLIPLPLACEHSSDQEAEHRYQSGLDLLL